MCHECHVVSGDGGGATEGVNALLLCLVSRAAPAPAATCKNNLQKTVTEDKHTHSYKWQKLR